MSGSIISVRGEAQLTVAPDRAQLNANLVLRRSTKPDALSSAATALARVVEDLAALGGSTATPESDRSPLSWMAASATTWVERQQDKQGNAGGPEQIVASVSIDLVVRDFALLPGVGSALATHEDLHVQHVLWQVDADNPAWAAVRAAAIEAALRKGRDYAAALGASIERVEHVADAGLISAQPFHGQTEDWMGRASLSGDTPSLDPVPQLLSATIEARLAASEISL